MMSDDGVIAALIALVMLVFVIVFAGGLVGTFFAAIFHVARFLGVPL